jgi:hypothetical protein
MASSSATAARQPRQRPPPPGSEQETQHAAADDRTRPSHHHTNFVIGNTNSFLKAMLMISVFQTYPRLFFFFKPQPLSLVLSRFLPAVPFFIFLIGFGGTIRAWAFMSSSECVLQILLLTIAALPLLTIAIFPRFFFKHNNLCLNTSRLAITLLPSAKHLIAKLVNADGSTLGQRWAESNPLGCLGILIFASRTLIFYASSIGMHMDFLPTVAVQLLLAAASYLSEPDLCKVKLAQSSLSSFRALHFVFNSAWAVAIPFPHVPTPPAEMGDPGVSLTAITLMIKILSLLAPIIQSARRATAEYYYRSCSASRLQDEDEEEDDLIYDPVANNLVYVGVSSRERSRNISRIRRRRVAVSINATTNTAPLHHLITLHNHNNHNHDSFRSRGTKKPPIEAQLILAVHVLRDYPIHAIWVAVVTTCSFWAACYSIADRYTCISAGTP